MKLQVNHDQILNLKLAYIKELKHALDSLKEELSIELEHKRSLLKDIQARDIIINRFTQDNSALKQQTQSLEEKLNSFEKAKMEFESLKRDDEIEMMGWD